MIQQAKNQQCCLSRLESKIENTIQKMTSKISSRSIHGSLVINILSVLTENYCMEHK